LPLLDGPPTEGPPGTGDAERADAASPEVPQDGTVTGSVAKPQPAEDLGAVEGIQ